MPVQIIVDCFDIDDQEAVIVASNEAAINAARHAIYQQLRANNNTLLRLRLNNLALYKHFREFEGTLGFAKQELKPRLLLAERFKTHLPDWLSDDEIVALGLLKNAAPVPSLAIEDQLLFACHANLLNGDFQAFIAALQQQPAAFLWLVAKDSIKKRLTKHLHLDLKIKKEAAELFITHLLNSPDIGVFCQTLAYQQYLQYLRSFAAEHCKNLVLPARALDTVLLTALPLLPLAQEQAQQLPQLFLSVLTALSQKIIAQLAPPEHLAKLLIVDWNIVWTEVTRLIEANPLLITTALVEQLQTLHSEAAQQLAKKCHTFLTAHCYPLLSATASVDEALLWSAGYFDYLRPILLNKQTPEEAINGSFTTWLLSQSVRIARSNADWRYCAKQIEKFLAQNYLVIVVMIDALSALNQDSLLQELASFDQLIRSDDVLFAPLPTLTEVGKMAVLTGKHSHLLPSDSEKALTQHYATDTKIIKSWEDANQHIEADTHLVVFFENRIDERLHDCVSFEKHRDDITPIIRQLKHSMQRWLKDAGQRDVVFFITADHGMTVTQGKYAGQLMGETKDRALKIQHSDNTSDDFVRLTQDSKEPYAVIKTRQALTANTVLAHGGLTPEEVLIPFITLTTRPPTPCKMPVKISIIGQCLRLAAQYWQLELRLTAEETVENIKLSLEPPFSIEKRPPIDIIRADKSHDISLKFTACCEQNGLCALDIQLDYDTKLDHEKNIQRLSVDFPAPLLERNSEAQSFEDMF